MIRRGSRSLDQLVEVGGSGHCTAAAAAAAAAAGMISYNERNMNQELEQIGARPSRPMLFHGMDEKRQKKGESLS